ncbi:Predicted ATPase [Amycolatopsis xylanica]|uniref:Predicted ATPase n=1 Tax=Amycolatopsis xylanica TaxID=589385 RepID=A0A1H3FV53_9PSEU|nr:NB-ARC domain-containing protein [Amycolatopsis xylanica]SDX94942.1 Predicted ATPase [Amycolatopsis xylanica]
MTNADSGESPTIFKDLLKSHRLRAKLTQEELSDSSGVSVRAISDMERGVAKGPRSQTVTALAAPLGLSEPELARLHKSARRGRAQPDNPTAVPFPAYALPADLDDLTGREHDLDALRALAEELRGANLRSGRVAVLSGPPGAGKTSLAVRAAHELAAGFPDGHLFLKLRGMSPEPRDPAAVLQTALRALGVDAQAIPAEPEQRAGLCQALLKDRAMLIVLDDAADEAQVRPLLIGGGRCLTLITARQMLVGLEGSRRLSLGVLDRDDAVALLTSIAGPRVTQEHTAALELVDLCDRLPLALRIAGNRLASRPAWSLSGLVEQLRDRNKRLTTLTAGSLSVRAVIELSYRQLSPAAAMAFRRLSLVPSADFSVGAAMALIDAAHEREVVDILEGLVDDSLLQVSDRDGRYQFHDLLAVFAAEQLAQEESEEAAEAAQRRLTDWLVGTAIAAFSYFQSGDFYPAGQVTGSPTETLSFSDRAGARRWLDVEADSWLSAARRSATHGGHQQLNELANTLPWFMDIGESMNAAYEVFELAVRSAVAIGSKHDEATHRINISFMHATVFGRPDAAIEAAREALEAAVAAGDPTNQGWAKVALMSGYLYTGTPPASTALLDEAARLFEEGDCQLGRQYVRIIRANYCHTAGLFADAALEFDACISDLRQQQPGTPTPGNDATHAHLLVRSAVNLATLNSFELAVSRCDEAFRLYDRWGSSIGKAQALRTSGTVQGRRGEHADARKRLTAALELFEKIGMLQCQADALCELADSADQLGDADTAREEREHALSLYEMLNSNKAAELRAKMG